MKTIVLASALVAGILVGTTSGRPFINKRALVTEVVYVTETVANVAVYVDENGTPYLTTTEAQVASIPSAVISTTPVGTTKTTKSAAASPISASSSKLVAPPVPSPALPSLTFHVPVPQPSSVEEGKPPTSAVSTLPSASVVKAQPTTIPPPPPPAPTSTRPAPPPAPTSTSPAPPPPAPTSTSPAPPPPAPTSTTPAPPPPAPTPAKPAPPPPASSSDVPVKEAGSSPLGLGVTYDPFTGVRGNSACKSDAQVAQDFVRMKDYKAVRIYAGDCNIIPLAVQHAIKNGQKLMAGAYLTHKSDGENLSQVIQTLKSAIDQYANHRWDVIALFSVENERVNEKDMTASDVIAAIQDARKQLRNLGYTGPVGAVETVPAMLDNPAICEASDAIMVNCHAFFDSNTVSSDAGTFVKSQVEMVKQTDRCKGKRVVVTESGWPHQGNTNGKAVASEEDQKAALASIRENFDHDMFLFNAFDSLWKSDTAQTFNAEPYWGIMR